MNLRLLCLLLCLVSTQLLMAQAVSSFTLVDANANTDLQTLTDGAVVNLADLPTTFLNIRANTNPSQVGSVTFYRNNSYVRRENVAPYALYGDNNGNYFGQDFTVGTYTYTATPHAGSNGSGTQGTAASVTITFIDEVPAVAPAAPTNLSATVPAPGQVVLNWADNSNNEDQFEIQWAPNDDTYPNWQVLATVSANTTTFTDNSFGTDYFRMYRVRATNSAGNSDFSNEELVDNLAVPPTNFSASNITETTMTLSWTAAPYGNDYLIEYKTDPNASFQQWDALYYGYTSLDYSGFSPGTTYYFRIRTNYQGQSSDWSNTLVVTTLSQGQSVTTLILVNADSNTDIGPLNDNDQLNLFYLGTNNLSVRAETNPATVGSIGFNYDGNANYQTENYAPYALAGDNSGNYNAWTPTVGNHTLVATPYSSRRRGGTVGNAMSVSFSVINQDTAVVYPTDPVVTGELKKWHKVTVSFTGPQTSETAALNPFMDYRLEVTFTNGNKTYVVPGYYAADGNAAESSATAGKIWNVHFSPDEIGSWNYSASFRQGSNVAVATNPQSGSPTSFDGQSGTFNITNSDKSGRDFRGTGRLEYVGEHYLQFAETGDYFIKAGADAAENTLAYEDFDEVPNRGNRKKSWSFHQQDYNAADANDYTWNGQGSELLGSVNYLSGQGMNVFSFLTFSLGGDDENVFPHRLKTSIANYNGMNDAQQWADGVYHDRFDVSRMAQWEKIFEYADKKGMYLHFKTMETENDNLMDGNSHGNERKIYYRELIARFGHHLALNWNITEEETLSTQVIQDIAAYIKAIDPYDHNIVIHTYPGGHAQYNDLTGNQSELMGASIQSDINNVHRDIKTQVDNSAAAGKKWIVANDEQGNAQTGVAVDANYPSSQLPDNNQKADNRDAVRAKVLWGTLLAGGAGVEYYYGYQTGSSDLSCQDHRTRETKWEDAKIALDFFNSNLSSNLLQMKGDDDLTSSTTDYVFAQTGEIYAIYLPDGGTTNLDLTAETGNFAVKWYDPRNGGALQNGTTLSGGTNATIGQAPNNQSMDWVALVTKISPFARLAQAVEKEVIEETKLRIYPNPVTDFLTIERTAAQNKLQVALFGLDGRQLLQLETSAALHRIDVSALGTGIYLLRIVDGKGVRTERIVVR